MINTICVYGVGGVGGVGGYFGAKIIENDNEKKLTTSFIARGAHMQAIKKDGLTLRAEDSENTVRPTVVTSEVSTIDSPDLILLCVKEYDLEGAIKSLEPIINDTTIILPLLNGVDIYDRIRSITQKGIVTPACVYVGTHILEPGVIFQKGGAARIIFGDDPNKKGGYGAEIAIFFKKHNIKSEYSPDPYPQIWTKYMFIAAYGMVTAATGKTLGALYDDLVLRDDVQKIMQEIELIAQAKNICLDKDVVDQSLRKAELFPYETKTSFQRDCENPDKKNEKELFGGTIIRLGRELAVPTPTTEKYYS